MLKTTLAGLRAHKVRLALTAFAIILGVAFVVATLTLSNGIQATFDGIFTSQGTHIAVVVRGHVEVGGENGGFGDAHHPVPNALVKTVSAISGVRSAEGVVFRPGASPLDPAGNPYSSGGAPEFAANWITSMDLSPYHLRAGRAPAQANEVVVDAATAAAHKITVGQHIQYVFNGGAKQEFVVSGIAGYGTSDTLAGATISLFTLDTTQRVMGISGSLDQIDLAASNGVTDTELRDRVAAALPSYAESSTGAEATGQQVHAVDSIFSIVRTVLLVFALIALFVGSYIIVNTFSILIAQRTRELALLRALGASRGQIFRSVLLEAVIIGIIGSAIGCVVGLLMAHGLYSIVSSIGNGLPPADLSLSAGTVATGMILGTLITVAASVLPARRASRVAPVEAIREAIDTAQPMGRRRIFGGAIVAVLGVALVGIGLFSGSSSALQILGFGAFTLFIGVSMLAPLTVGPIAGTLGAPIEALRGTPGKLARLNAVRAPRRAASTAAALMIGVTLVVGIAVLTESTKASTTIALRDAVRADYLVFSKSSGGSGLVDPAIVATLARDKLLVGVQDLRQTTVVVSNAATSALALDDSLYQQVLALDVASGDAGSLGQADTMFVDQQQAAAHGWHVGDKVPVTFPNAEKTIAMRIGCIFNSNALVQGFVISKSTYGRYVTQPKAFAILARVAPGVSHSAGLESLNRDLRAFPTLKAFDAESFLALQSQQLSQFTNTIDVFLLMAIIIAALGIVNTLALSIIERTREIGLLRAIGLTRRQTRTMIRWESVLIAFVGLVLGTVLGLALGVAVVHALAASGIGHVAIPFLSLLSYALGALIIGLAAAVLPARRAARLRILDAIASE